MPKVRLRDLNPAIFLNKVGIGTDDPAELLDVVGGNVRIGKTTNGRLIIENSSGTVKVQLDSNGNSYINGGKVGIGTGSTAPVNKLQIVGGTSITDGGAASPAASDGLHLMFDTATKVSWIKSEKLNTSNRGLQFLASQYIFNTGNVGIGTGTNPPEVLLHCSGGANEAGLRLGRSSGLLTDGTTYIGSLEFQDDTTNPPVKLRAVRTGSGGAAAMTFETGNASDVAERVRITSDGKVGIGTETGTVSSLLHIKQSSGGDSIMLDIECNNDGGIRFGRSNHGSLIYHRTTAKDYMGFVCDGSAQPTAPSNAQLPMMVINEDGNIGMGTGSDALTHKLEIRDIGKFTFDGSGNPELSITNNTATSLTNGTASLVFGQAANSRGGKIVSGRDGDYGSTADRSSFMAFYTSRSAYDTEAMRISSDGKIIFRSGRTCLHAANDSSLPSGITEYAVVLENTQGANDREFNIADITRSTSGWGYSHYTVEIFAHYPTGGSYSKYFVYYVYSSVGVKTIQEPIGVNVSGYGVRLAGEQTVSGNIKRASIMIDLPAYGKATVKLTHVGATHVSSWNSSNENFASRIKYNI